MFLAWRELMHNKSKFSLIVSLIVLITYLVYFLISLAFGLATSYTNGIDKINANYIILSENSNDNAMMSMLTDSDFNDVITSGQKEKLGLFPAVISNVTNPSSDSKADVYVFGVEDVNFFLNLPQNTQTLSTGEIIVDSSLIKNGYEIGDSITMPGTMINWTIKEFTEKSTYQTAPIIYVNLTDWKEYRFNNQPLMDYYNAIIVKGNVEIQNSAVLAYTIKDYISTLPGYTAQVLTFSLMIGFLVVIIAFVLGIFIYVLTVQKAPIFGVMKAQGISNSYIANSVLFETIIIMFFGAIIGLALTLVSGYFLGGVVPFAINYVFYSLITVAFFAFSILGGLFSVSSITKIDPLKAIK